MFKIIGTVKNNLSESKYLKNINSVELKQNAIEDNNSNNQIAIIDEDTVKKDLDILQDGIRHKNLKIFASNLFKARLEQFLIVTLPACLVAGTITLWALPAKHVKTESLETYKKFETVISGDRQINTEGEKSYYYTFLGRDFVDEEKCADFGGGSSNKTMEIYITENLEGFLGNITIKSDGSLSVSGVSSGTYINLNDYDFSNAQEIDDKYVDLFDKTIDLMLDSGYISNSGKEQLQSIRESDKKQTVASIISYENLGYTDVEVYKSNWFWRIALSVITGIYLWALIYVLKEEGLPDFYPIYNKNGELIEAEDPEQMGLFYLGTKYKEAFIAAEKDRIRRIYEICDKNFTDETKDIILTSYEKKLIYKPLK